MEKHTPGPWRVKDRTENETIVFAGKNFKVAEVEHPHWDDEAKANAALIAAAPELLAACEAARESLNGFGTEDKPLLDMIDNAINRATGA